MAILKLKNKFYQGKNPILIYDINSDRIVVSNKIPFGKKGSRHFIGHQNDDEKFMPFCTMVPKWVHTEDILKKLCIFFFDKRQGTARKI